MQFARILILLFLFGTFIATAAPPNEPQTNLPERELSLGKVVIKVPVASTPEQRTTGLMHRTSLEPNEGMLFVFDYPQRLSFWMKNTLVPLSIAYIDSKGTIMEIYDMEPLNEQAIASTSIMVLYALEMPKGWFEKNGIKPGTVVEGISHQSEPKSP